MKTAAPLDHASASERYVLGAILLRPESLAQIDGWFSPDDLTTELHRAIYRTCQRLGADTDVVTVGEAFPPADAAYVIGLAQDAFSAASIVAHAEIVAEHARLRRLRTLGAKLAHATGSSAEQAMLAQAELAAITPAKRTGLLAAKPLLRTWFDDLCSRYDADRMPGQPWPWRDLNSITHGLQDGEVTVIAARPGTGKSLLGFQAAAFTALRGNRVAVFSLEMTATQVMRRCVSALGSVPHEWLIEPSYGAGDHWAAVTHAVRDLSQAPLHVDDSPALTTADIAARARRLHLQAPIRLLLVDHLHEVRVAGKQGEVIERGQAAKDIKALAKELGCPAILLAQLNRGSESESRRPTMRDLRAAGGIEEAADVILFPYRAKEDDEHIELLVGKGRDIKRGKPVLLRDRYDVMRADDWDGPAPVCDAPVPIRSRGFGAGFGRDRAAGGDR